MNEPTTCHLDFAHQWRGGQRQAFLLTTGLAAHGLRTVVVTREGTPLAQRLAGTGVEVRTLRVLGEFDLLAAHRLAQIVRDCGAQILAAHASHEHGLAALAKRRLGADVKLVVHRRVDVPVGNRLFGMGKYGAPDAFIAISETVRRVLIESGVAAEKIRVVSSGVPPHQRDEHARARLADACGLPADGVWVGSVADLVEHKGHIHLLRAWAQMPATDRAHLVLIGDGPLHASLLAQAREMNIADSVHFVGRRDDVPAWLSALDVFALTSETEGLGSSIIDAMMADLPVVATAAGGIPELVRNNETGLLAPVGDDAAIADALRVAMAGGERVAQLTANAKAMVEQERSAAAMTEKTLAVYRGILGK